MLDTLVEDVAHIAFDLLHEVGLLDEELECLHVLGRRGRALLR